MGQACSETDIGKTIAKGVAKKIIQCVLTKLNLNFTQQEWDNAHNSGSISNQEQAVENVGSDQPLGYDLSKITQLPTDLKRCVLICCNTYTRPDYSLGVGPMNDALSVASYMKEIGFDIYFIHNPKSKNFLKYLSHFIKNTKEYLVVYYTGHGGSVKDKNADEDDGYDEALVFDDKFLIDDDLADAIASAGKPESSTVCLINYKLIQFPNNCDEDILNQIKESQAIMIDSYQEENLKYFFICFDDYFLIIDQINVNCIKNLFSSADSNKIYLFNEAKDDFLKIINLPINESNNDENSYLIFEEEISNFQDKFIPYNIFKSQITAFWNIIRRCISGFLIKKSYLTNKTGRIKTFFINVDKMNEKEEKFKENDFITLRSVQTSRNLVYFSFNFQKQQTFCIKVPQKSSEREIKNYRKLYHPFISQFYGTVDINGESCPVVEFISGQDLNLCVNKFDFKSKVTILLNILLIIHYLHKTKFIYRDLKGNNVIIGENNYPILIDFDEMIESNTENCKTDDFSRDFATFFSAPELYEGNFKPSCKTDIFSFGKMIYFVLLESTEEKTLKLISFKFKYPVLYQIYIKCIDKKQENRPSTDDLLKDFENYIFNSSDEKIKELRLYMCSNAFFNEFFILISLSKNENDSNSQVELAKFYFEGEFIRRDMNKALYYFNFAANQNNKIALYNLGNIYYEGKYIEKDINKAIHYYELASNQQVSKAQFKLGRIYYDNKNVEKSIYYFTLAAKQNDLNALINLGMIYDVDMKDIEKSIHFYKIAADQNHPIACYNLGAIYYTCEDNNFNINKAIHYLKIASDNLIKESMYYLGEIYITGKFIEIDIEKAIFYLTKASDLNDSKSQLLLGDLYFNGNLIPIDIKKAIKYFELAANQNEVFAQFNLGLIYSSDYYVPHDVKKTIYYYSLAANQNDSLSQLNLGIYYYRGVYFPKNIEKALFYIKLAADINNNPNAQFFLFNFYFKGDDIKPDYYKGIYYLKLAADQGMAEAQYSLGIIFYSGEYISRNMASSIHYLTLSANQNYVKAQYDLATIYYEGKYINKNIQKAINLYILAANQKHIKAIFNLALIYFENIYVPIDIHKSIFYFSISAKLNHPKSHFMLGKIYFTKEFNVFDVNKAVYYMELAANSNFSLAQNFLGAYYIDFNNDKRDVQKSINYFTTAANNNCATAQSNLGLIYLWNIYIERDIEKAIHYLTLAANNGIPNAQGVLGILYLTGDIFPKNLELAKKYLHISADNYYYLSQRVLGDLYLEGKILERDINKSIFYYKQSLIKNDPFSKNNLAIIYKNGFGGVKRNNDLAKEYLKEVCNQNNFVISMFNLAKIYYHEETIKGYKQHKRSIFLLATSFALGLTPSALFFILILLKRFKSVNLIMIENQLKKVHIQSQKLANSLYKVYLTLQPFLSDESICDYNYSFIQKYDLIIINFKIMFTNKLDMCKKEETPKQIQEQLNVNNNFYDGFGKDLMSSDIRYI